ncbi:MAG: carboxypeptidase-like regulatory domain-containing protein [Chthoniobacterales bacterium]
MRIIARCFIGLVVAAASVAYAALPQIKVTVADSSGKTTYKGATNASGAFATGTLQPGNYLVQFTSTSAPKGTQYAFVISAGKKKVSATAIDAARLAGGGVAMKIDVGAGLNITGQVADQKNSAPLGKNGKPMVWIGKKLGSNMPAHWADSDSAEAKEAMTSGSYSTKNLQDKQNQGISPH